MRKGNKIFVTNINTFLCACTISHVSSTVYYWFSAKWRIQWRQHCYFVKNYGNIKYKTKESFLILRTKKQTLIKRYLKLWKEKKSGSGDLSIKQPCKMSVKRLSHRSGLFSVCPVKKVNHTLTILFIRYSRKILVDKQNRLSLQFLTNQLFQNLSICICFCRN